MFIVLEGLDGAGKSTQIRLLRDLLAERGVASEYVHFPRFDAPVYGELIARFLRGEFGGVNEVDPYLVALLFAGDRAEAGPMIRQWLSEGRAVILDRYVWSNVGFQCAKLPAGEARERLAAVDSGPRIRPPTRCRVPTCRCSSTCPSRSRNANSPRRAKATTAAT